MSTYKYLQVKKTTTSFSVSDSEINLQLDFLTKLDGTSVSSSDFGYIQQFTLDPATSKEEICTVLGSDVTVNADGTISLANVNRGRKEVYPYGSGGFATDHGAGAVVVFSNNPQLYDQFANKHNDETIVGKFTFPSNANRPIADVDTDTANAQAYVTFGQLYRTTLDGAVKATVAIFGLVRLSVAPSSAADPVAVGDNDPRIPTQAENDAMVGNGGSPSSSNKYITEIGFTTAYKTEASYYGNGADGAAVLNGANTFSWASKVSSTYTLTQDVKLTNLTIDNGVILETNGYVICGNGTLTNNGIIRNNGGAGGNGGAGIGGGNGGAGGTAGTAAPGGSLTAGTAGVAGGTGANYLGSGGTAGTTGIAKTSLGSNGANGGAGSSAAGSGGTNTLETMLLTTSYLTPAPLSVGVNTVSGRATFIASTNNTALSASSGSGAGGGGAGAGNGGGGGGGSGATGGVIVITFATIVNGATGYIQSNGGAGGAGGASGGGGTNSGGGAGGNGGTIALVYTTLTDTGTIQATGGAAGAVGTGGTGGAAGTIGTAGKIFKVVL